MSTLALLALALLLPMLAVAVYNARTAPRLERARPVEDGPRVSLLVPARDEAHNLAATLPPLLAQRYPRLEIVLLDDHSRDGTADVARRIAAGDPRVRVLRGAPLPPGWLGKNWACHQLARAARGDLLVYCDADVYATPDAVGHTVALMEAMRAGAATAVIRQRLGGWVERAVVPLVVHLPVVAMLPLRQVPRTRTPSLGMGNGQWLAFTREAYARCGGHAAVRGEVLEDVALARRVKAAGDRLVVALAPHALAARMYRTPGELRQGFGKNLYALMGGHPAALAAWLAVLLLTGVVPWVAAASGSGVGIAAVGALLALRAVQARLLGLTWPAVVLHPLGVVLVTALALESAAGAMRGRSSWKGRVVAAGRPGRNSGAGGQEEVLDAADTEPPAPLIDAKGYGRPV